MTKSLRLRMFVKLGLLWTFSSCAHVAAYERAALSTRAMDPRRESSEIAFQSHVHDAREGATGGASSTGGGCGCN